MQLLKAAQRSPMKTVSTELLSKSTCPNCWSEFAVENVKWIAAHDDLLHDERLGDDMPQRFRPTRFDVGGNAIDVKGMQCKDLACPNCHLKIPRSVIVFRPFFISIAGTPSCGKSFYLASMAWQIRKTLPEKFGVLVGDSDGECNKILNDYEEQLFFNSDPSQMAKLAKTDMVGDWYSQVQYEGQTVTYPKPFYFDLRPKVKAGRQSDDKDHSRLLCLYDNAGESFLPGADTVSNPVTRHLGLAEAWLFCFDPSQDPRIRKVIADRTDDHQVRKAPVTARQETVLNEMVNRIRRHSSLGLKDRSNKPLFVVCTKFDAWSNLLGELPEPWAFSKRQQVYGLNMSAIESVSKKLKRLLSKHCPEVVASSQSISNRVYYIPVSATGCSPVKDSKTGDYMVRTDSIKPVWCEVPVLLALAHRAPKLVRAARKASSTPAHSNDERKAKGSE